MTRLFPVQLRLLQESSNALLQQDLIDAAHIPEQNMVNLTINNSIVSFPLSCHSVKDFHSAGIFYGDNPLAHSFSLVMFNLIFITAITSIFRILLKPFKQPLLISQIISAVILGPSFLGRFRWYQVHMETESSKFLINNLGMMGFMLFVFIYGVKMDPSLLRRSGKLHISTALIGITVPIVIVSVVAQCMKMIVDEQSAMVPSLGAIAGYVGITAFPVLYIILKEFNLLNSDLARFALSTALIGDTLGMAFIVFYESSTSQGDTKMLTTLWYMISFVGILGFLVFCVRPIMFWINNNTREGHPVQQIFVVVILLAVFSTGFVTDMLGLAIGNGPLFLGLVIPNGPGVAATLVKKSETIMTELFLPFSFILVGSNTDFYAMSASGWSSLSPLFVMVVTGYIIKFLSTWIILYFWRIPIRDGLILGLITSLRGHVELLLFVHWLEKTTLNIPDYTLLVIMTAAVTAICTPLINIFYDPTRPYMVSQRRNIQHNPPDEELRIVLCILDPETVNSLIRLLDISNPTSSSPFSISVVRLSELVGRGNPLFVDHEKQEVPDTYQWTNTINILEHHQELKGMSMQFHFFTSAAPKPSMFRDICELALEKETSLIILPFDSADVHNHSVRTVNAQVLNSAPCSVAIFVDKGLADINNIGSSCRRTPYRFAVLFLGGGDAREALCYADRMAANQDVSLTVIRFLSHNFLGYDEMEKKLDDGIVTWFWAKNEMNERVVVKEVVVRNGEETTGAIRAMNDGAFDLFIVGRKYGINPILLTGLSEWSENEELGIIGDYISSPDFFGSASVLVVQQQILRG